MNKEILTAVPPLTADYFIESTDGNAVTVNVLANSLARELAIDPATVEIITLPNTGSATVTAPGEITFVPGAKAYEFSEVNITVNNMQVAGLFIWMQMS